MTPGVQRAARGTKARSWLRALLVRVGVASLVVMALVFAVLTPGPARAGELSGAAAAPTGEHAAEEVAKTPRDVPMVVQPSGVVIPPVPDTYQRRDLGWLSLAYPASAHERIEPLLRDADDLKAQLTDELGQPVLVKPIEVRVARGPEDMASLAPDLPLPTYASAVAIPGLRLILLSMRAPFTNEGTDLEELLRHELAHIALDDAVGGRHVPIWLNEGYAMHASGESGFERARVLTDATLWKTLIPLADLDRSLPSDLAGVDVAYAESADFVRFLLRNSDRARFAGLIDRVHKGEPFDRSLTDAYTTDLRKLEYEWREELAKRYTFWPVLMSGSLVWVLVIGALGVGWLRKRRRDRAVYARWEREEALEAARHAVLTSAAASSFGSGPPPPPEAGAPSVRALSPSVPKIEHEGDWHTLH